MNTAVMTVIGAIILMGLVVALFGIGWIITGKMKLNRKSCGSVIKKKKEDGSCGLCGKSGVCEEETKEDEEKEEKKEGEEK